MEENGEGSSPTLGQKVTNFVDGLRGWNALDSPGMEREARRNFLQLSRLEKSYDRQLIANLGEWPRTKRPRTSRSQERQMFITRPTETEENGKKVRSWYCYTDTGAVLKYSFVEGVDDKAEEAFTANLNRVIGGKKPDTWVTGGGYAEEGYWRVPEAADKLKKDSDGASFLAALDAAFTVLKQEKAAKNSPVDEETFRNTRQQLSSLAEIK